MQNKSIYTRSLGLKVANNAQPEFIRNFHVISRDSTKWTVVSDGKVRPIKVFTTRQAAINFAKKTASIKTGIVFIHHRSGQLKSKISYSMQ